MKLSLTGFLLKYLEWQEDISLVYRPTLKDSWRRAVFLGEGYERGVPYNHRSILSNEIVLEYDNDNPEINKACVRLITKKFNQDGIAYAKWFSGNKSTHLHILINIKNAKHLAVLKKTIMTHYGTYFLYKGKILEEPVEGSTKILPDLRLAAQNSLIRAEYGVHEKSGGKKYLIHRTPEYPIVSSLPDNVWLRYLSNVKKHIARKLTYNTSSLETSPQVKFLLSTDFRDCEDGRERALFMLIHILKSKYKDNKDEFTQYLQDWYRYSGGTKLSPWAITCKVNYHWEKEYSINITLLDTLLEELDISFKKADALS